MKKYNNPDQNACMVKMNNRRVIVQRLEDNSIYLGFKRMDSPPYNTPIILSAKEKPKLLNIEITETGITLSGNSAFALYEALKYVITLSDIPSECLILNQNYQ